MKGFVITLAIAGLVSTAPLDAQILNRLPTTSADINVDGSWRVVGRDNNGNTLYERRTRDRNGNVLVQRAVRDSNGNFRIVSSRTINDDRNRRDDCTYSQTTNSVGDIIFGRTGNVNNCDDRNSRVEGGWYQVGRDGNGNRLYERRIRDNNGNVIIQRARRNSNGSFSIISSRNVGRGNGDWNNGRGNQKDDKEWKKEQKRREKEWKKDHKNDHGDRGDHGNRGDHGDHGYSNHR